jgi:hypothetical protein
LLPIPSFTAVPTHGLFVRHAITSADQEPVSPASHLASSLRHDPSVFIWSLSLFRAEFNLQNKSFPLHRSDNKIVERIQSASFSFQ